MKNNTKIIAYCISFIFFLNENSLYASQPLNEKQNNEVEVFDFTLQHYPNIDNKVTDIDYLDLDDIPDDLRRIAKSVSQKANDQSIHLLALILKHKEQTEYTKYLFASTGLLNDKKAQKKAHKYGYHLIQAYPNHCMVGVLAFLEKSPMYNLFKLIIHEEQPVCIHCSLVARQLFNQVLKSDDKGCNALPFPNPAPRLACACFYSERFTPQQRKLVQVKLDSHFPNLAAQRSTKKKSNSAQKPLRDIPNSSALHLLIRSNIDFAALQNVLPSLIKDINSIDGEGKTPLDYTEKESQSYYLLAEYGAKTNQMVKTNHSRNRPPIGRANEDDSKDDYKEDQKSTASLDKQAIYSQTAQGVNKTGFRSSKAQEEANRYTEIILEGVENTNYDKILIGVHGLRKVPINKTTQPDALIRKLLKVYKHGNAHTLNVAYKHEIAKQIRRLAQALFFLTHRKENAYAFDKSLKKEYLEPLQEALDAVEENAWPAAGVRFELECTRAAIGGLSDGKNWKDYAKEEGVEVLIKLVEGLVDGGISTLSMDLGGVADSAKELLKNIGIEKAKQACDFAVKKFRSQWYKEVLYVDYLNYNAIQSVHQHENRYLNEIYKQLSFHTKGLLSPKKNKATKPLKKKKNLKETYKKLRKETKKKFKNLGKETQERVLHAKGQWQVIYVLLQAIGRVAAYSQHTNQVNQSIEKLSEYANYEGFLFKNNWRIRECVARSLLFLTDPTLTNHQSDDIAKKAIQIIATRKLQEKDNRVHVLLSQPEYVTVLESTIRSSNVSQLPEIDRMGGNLTVKLQEGNDLLLKAFTKELQRYQSQQSEEYKRDIHGFKQELAEQNKLLQEIQQTLKKGQNNDVKSLFESRKEEFLMDMVVQLHDLQQQAEEGNLDAKQKAQILDRKLTLLEENKAETIEIKGILTNHQNQVQLQLTQILQEFKKLGPVMQSVAKDVKKIHHQLEENNLLIKNVNSHLQKMHEYAEKALEAKDQKIKEQEARIHKLESKESNQKALYEATRKDDQEKVKQLLEQGVEDINKTNEEGLAALHIAAKGGSLDMVKLLVGKKANIKNRDEERHFNAFHYAVFHNHLNVAKFLLLKKSDIIEETIFNGQYKGYSALHLAASKNFPDMTQLLIKKEAEIDAPSLRDGFTPLLYAVLENNTEIVTILLEEQAELYQVAFKGKYKGYNALHIAVYHNFIEMTNILLEEEIDKERRVGFSKNKFAGKTALEIAEKKKYNTIIDLLKGRSVPSALLHSNTSSTDANQSHNAQAASNTSQAKKLTNEEYLHQAIKAKNLEAINDILQKNVNLNYPNKIGQTPLHHAATHGYAAIVAILLAHNAYIDLPDSKEGSTALHWAVFYNHLDVTKLLLDAGADIEAIVVRDTYGFKGQTALHLAALKGFETMTQFLLNRGADKEATVLLGAKRYAGYTPSQIAQHKGHDRIVTILTGNRKKTISKSDIGVLNRELLDAVESNNSQDVAKLLKQGADVNHVQQKSGKAPLHIASTEGYPAIVKILLSYKSDIEARDRKEGSTSLHWAVFRNHLECVKLLLNAGADIEAVVLDDTYRFKGQTPLHLSALKGFPEMTKLLLKMGAYKDAIVPPGAKRFVGLTPLEIAKKKEKKAIINILQQEDYKKEWFQAALSGDKKKLEYILNKYSSIDINMRGTKYNTTALIWSAYKGHLDAVKLLVQRGADQNLRESGKTALQWAQSASRMHTVQFLEKQ